jgi:hypothetical protein
MIMVTWPNEDAMWLRLILRVLPRRGFISRRLAAARNLSAPPSGHAMITLRVTRHDRNEQLLAECQSACIPARGEVLQLDTVQSDGTSSRPSTMWRIVAVTMHVPSIKSEAPGNGEPLRVRTVEVSVLPDVSLLPGLMQSAEQQLAESRM